MYRLLSIFLVLVIAGAYPATAQVSKTNEVVSLRDGLKEMLQVRGATSLKKLSINVDEEHARKLREQGVSASGAYTVYQGVDADGALIGSVLIINERGKEGPLQVLVAVNSDAEIYDIGFTLFGEDKGKPAMNWSFLSQFIDQNVAGLNDVNVDGVSGATWTSESVSSAIIRGAALYALFLADS